MKALVSRNFSLVSSCLACVVLGCGMVGAADNPQSQSRGAKLSAQEIVSRNVAARGGLQAWRSVQTMSFTGKLGAGGNRRETIAAPNSPKNTPQALNARPEEEVMLPFTMELKRPRKMRFELEFNNQTAVQVFDGANGWKLRPFLNRREVEPYTTDEMKLAALQDDLDGPLIDSAAKGTRVELEGMEDVDGRDTYRLKLNMKSGRQIHAWIDAQTFLEAKMEGAPRRLDGIDHPVEVFFKDYRAVNGIQIPFLLETKVLLVARTASGLRDTAVPPEKTIIEKVLVNPKLDEARFSKPEIGTAVASK